MEDREIIELFFGRQERAISELAGKYGSQCRRLAYNILKNERDAEEAVNDAYLAVWRTIPPENPEVLPAYLLRIVRNLSIKKYDANTAKKRNSYYDLALEEAEGYQGKGETVEEEILAQEMVGEINRFLAEIRARDRILFVQRYWFCESISSMAESMGVTENYVRVHLHRTRERLRKYLKKEGLL